MPFGMVSRVGYEPCIRWEYRSPTGMGNFLGGWSDGAMQRVGRTCHRPCKNGWTYQAAVWDSVCGGPGNRVFDRRAHWRHLANMIKRLWACVSGSVSRSGGAACFQITWYFGQYCFTGRRSTVLSSIKYIWYCCYVERCLIATTFHWCHVSWLHELLLLLLLLDDTCWQWVAACI